jgi:hypothetical protein
MVTFFMLSGTAMFNSGGNINLTGSNSVMVNGSITFVRNDLTGPLQAWTPVAQWSLPTGAGATPAGFTVSASPTSATIYAGDSPTFNLTVTPTGGFSGAVQFICIGAPPKSTCSVSPNPVTVNGTSPAPATVMVTSTAPSAQALNSDRRNVPLRRSLSSFGSLAAGLILGMVPVSSGQLANSRKNRKKWSLIPCLFLLLVLCLGCGGAVMASGSPPPPVQPGTPQGIYMLTITGASGNTNQSTTITLTVQ